MYHNLSVNVAAFHSVWHSKLCSNLEMCTDKCCSYRILRFSYRIISNNLISILHVNVNGCHAVCSLMMTYVLYSQRNAIKHLNIVVRLVSTVISFCVIQPTIRRESTVTISYRIRWPGVLFIKDFCYHWFYN